MKESVGVGVVSRHAATMRYGEPSQAGPGSLFNGYRILYHQILRQESMEACGACCDRNPFIVFPQALQQSLHPSSRCFVTGEALGLAAIK